MCGISGVLDRFDIYFLLAGVVFGCNMVGPIEDDVFICFCRLPLFSLQDSGRQRASL